MPYFHWDLAARALRSDAVGARRLASSFADRKTVADLHEFAATLEEHARELEAAAERPAAKTRRHRIFE